MEQQQLTVRQLRALGAVWLLAPALRLYPATAAELAGRAAWLSPLLALPAALGYGWLLHRLLARRLPGEDTVSLLRRALGERASRAVLLLIGLFFLFYAAFSLRSGAQRFITTIFPQAKPVPFALSMGVLAALAAAGPLRTLGRCGKVILPVLLLTLGFILLAALPTVRLENLLPLRPRDALPALAGALPGLDVLAAVLFLSLFLSAPGEGQRFAPTAVWIALLGLLLSLLGLTLVGNFGAELTASLQRPFFYLVRNLVFFRNVERVEALVVALWVFSDFLLVSCSLTAGVRCLAPALDRPEKRLSILCALAAAVLACFLGRSAASYAALSERVVPLAGMSLALLLLPGCFLMGKWRRKI